MIILVGGYGLAGKTKLAFDLMVRHKISYFPIDHLMMGIYRSNPGCGYNPESDEVVINKVLWPIVLEMIKTNIENNHSMIFEGFLIKPTNILSIQRNYAKEIIPFFLLFSTEYIQTHYMEIIQYRSAIESRNDVFGLETLVAKNEELRKECEQLGINYFEIKKHYVDEIFEIKRQIGLVIDSFNTGRK